MLTRIFELTGITIDVFGLEVYFTIYIPMMFCIPVCLMFGFLWAAIPAYLSTFLVALLGDMPLHWVLVFSFANPVGLAMLAMIYRITPSRINLRSITAYLVFVVASFLSALAGSIGSFIWTYTNQVDIHDFYQVWQGWWVGGLLQAVVISAALLFVFADWVKSWKTTLKTVVKARQDTRNSIKTAVIVITIVLIGFIWLALYFNMLNIGDKLKAVTDLTVRKDVSDAVHVLYFPALVFVFILAFIGYFILYFVDYWAMRLEGINQELATQNKQLYDLSTRDSLTQIHNRAYLFSSMPALLTKAKSKKTDLSIFLFDLDYFKTINDRHGHKAGDLVLQEFTRTISQVVNQQQIFARFGGEEFILVAPDCSLDQAEQYAARLMDAVRQLSVHYKNQEIVFTVSVGVYVTDQLNDAVDHMIDEADKALYAAKQQGRDQAVVVSRISDQD